MIGAGIIGAWIAWHLARRGAAVTVIEPGEPGGMVTRDSWAWINASMSQSETYFRLRANTVAFRDFSDASLDEWIESLRRVEGIEFDILAPGHGALGNRANVTAFRNYLEDLRAQVLTAARAGKSLEETKKSVSGAGGCPRLRGRRGHRLGARHSSGAHGTCDQQEERHRVARSQPMTPPSP
ncbi:MAG: FAD-dependent oxidoreductase [Reyranella sp.]